MSDGTDPLEVEAALLGLGDFVDYVLSFYGPDGIYPNMTGEFAGKPGVPDDLDDAPFTRAEVLTAAIAEHHTSGDFEGDSFDRERVRDRVFAGRGIPQRHLEHTVAADGTPVMQFPCIRCFTMCATGLCPDCAPTTT